MDSFSTTTTTKYPRKRGVRALYPVFRWLHVYLSMVSFGLIFLFAVTGLTLNHLEWEWVSRESEEFLEGELPAAWRTGEEVDWLTVVEFLREAHGVRGQLEDYRADDFEAAVAFRGPGYAADAFIDPESGVYDLMVVQAGAIGILNDLHRGHGGGGLLRAAVDISAIVLILLSLTGMGILVFLRKFRVSGIAAMLGGMVLVALLILRVVS